MCSWGHVAKNSTACSHEWRAHSTIALVFSTKAWHGQKKVIFWPQPQMSGWDTKRHQHRVGELRAAPEASPTFGPTYWTIFICLNTLQENVTWKQPGACHGILCFCWWPSSIHACSIDTLPPCSNGLPCLSWVTALPLWHKSSIWFHLTGAMNNLIRGIIISS